MTSAAVDFVLNPPTVERESLLDRLVVDVRDGIMVLAYRDGLSVTIEMATERARNIVAGQVGNYQIRPLAADEAPLVTAQSEARDRMMSPYRGRR